MSACPAPEKCNLVTCYVEVEYLAKLGLCADLTLVGATVGQLDPGNGQAPPVLGKDDI